MPHPFFLLVRTGISRPGMACNSLRCPAGLAGNGMFSYHRHNPIESGFHILFGSISRKIIIFCSAARVAGFISMTGTAYASRFRVFLESNENRDAGAEVFMASYGTFEDVVNASAASLGFPQLNLGANFSVGGLAFEPDPLAPVPLPASGPMLVSVLVSVLGAGAPGRRRGS